MKMSRRLAVLLAVLFVFSVAGVVRAEHGPWDGYCDGDKPVFTHPLPPGTEYTAYCNRGSMVVSFPADPPPEKLPEQDDRPHPDDFAHWAVIEINGQLIRNPYTEAYPFVTRSTSRTLVPIRLVTEALGGTAEWFQDERKVRVSWHDRYMEMVIDSVDAVANGTPVVLDQAPILFNGRTLVPARAVTEAFGATVEWIANRKLVVITLEGAVCPDIFCAW